MKKIFIGLLLTIITALISLYFFIPSQIKVNKIIVVNAALRSVSRDFLREDNWNKWLKKETQAVGFEKNGLVFMNLKTVSENDAWLIINSKENASIKSYINITSLKVDTTLITLGCVIETSINPFKRWQHYQYAKKIKKSFDEIAIDFKIYIENFKQVYGFTAYKTTLMDSSMIAIKASVGNYPTVEDIYKKIEILEKYAAENNAIATNFPMLNILKTDSNIYSFMVALPINKLLKNKGDILYKQMLVNGNFITTDSIYGGLKKTEKLFRTFIAMKEDYQLMSPAIPFQSLITDRRKEADTTKWITRFYYPIF